MLCCDPALICKWDANVELWKNNFKEAWGCFEVSSKGQTIKCKSQGEQSTTPKLPHLWCEGWMTFKWWNSMLWYHQSNISQVLKPVCCKKQQKKVPDQLLVCWIGDLWKTWMIPNWLFMSPSDSPDHSESILYHSKSSEVPYSTNQ